MRLITVVTPCFNEEGQVRSLHEATKAVFATLPGYRYEHIFIDNASKDKTVLRLKEMAREDPSVKLIVNTRNFGHIRSPFHGLLQAGGDAVILMASDFQDPPDLIREFVRYWEEGYKIVIAVKTSADESPPMFFIRSLYYDIVNRLTDIDLTKNSTGFGLYDQEVIKTLRKIDDPYPYFRGLISDIGYESAKVVFHQPERRGGFTKNNFYTLYDIAMLGITNHSKVPLRVATMAGFLMAAVSLFIALAYLVAKLLFWSWFTVGIAPIIISLFFFSSVQLFFIGIIGEYIGAIHTQVQKRPLVIEKERVNF